MDIEIEQKDNGAELSENKAGIPDSKFIDELNKFVFNKTSNKEINDRIMIR